MSKIEDICVSFFGGPNHGEKRMVPDNIAWLNANGGHYARCGGLRTEMFWHNFPAPFAYLQNGTLWPVRHANQEATA